MISFYYFQVDAENKRLKIEVCEKDKLISKLREKITSLERQLETKEGIIKVFVQRIENLQKEREKYINSGKSYFVQTLPSTSDLIICKNTWFQNFSD